MVINFNEVKENDEERAYEDRLVKACTQGDLEVIQEYFQRKCY